MPYTNEEWQALSTAERVEIRKEYVALKRKAMYWDAACFVGGCALVYACFYILAC